MRFFLSYFSLMACIYVCRGQLPYNYTEVIRLSNIFYQIQEQIVSPDNDIPWREDCFVDDGQDVGRNLAGGHFDGGDFTKFLFPYAAFTTMLNWGLIDFFNGYDPSVLNQTLANSRVALEYLVRMHPEPNVIYGQIGVAALDHALWERCQEWPLGPRPTFQINTTAPGSELASEFAAAFASGFLIFEHRDPDFARQLLQHAIDAYEFAYNYRGSYSDSIPEARENYNSWSGYGDDLGWGAVWLLRATNNVRSYKPRLDTLWCQQNYHGVAPYQFSWDDKFAGLFILGNRVLNDIGYGESRYREKGIEFCDRVMNTEQTPEGLTWLGDHGPLRLVSNAAFACLNLAEQSNVPNADQYRAWARSQLHYILGDSGRSFIIGFGEDYPINAHHRQSSCPPAPAPCGWNFHNSDQNNFHECTGGLVRGPDRNDTFVDERQNFEHTDVALDFNAGLQSNMAALNQMQLQGKF